MAAPSKSERNPAYETVLLISAFLPVSDLEAQMVAIDELLHGLIIR